MLYKILFVTATTAEGEALDKVEGLKSVQGGYRCGNLEIIPLVAGVGSIATAWEMQKWISMNDKPDLAINCGIAGSYKKEIQIGDVVMPVSDCFADAGVEDGNRFLTLSEAGLADANRFPFHGGHILADNKFVEILKGNIKPVRAITVNTATGSDFTRERLISKFNPDIESMEGAAFFYLCSREQIPFLSLRAISNMVEIRNRNNWNIPLALHNLSGTLNQIILKLK
jgi:futalosine hydrolase